ncbi:MAG: DUF933 domain-containing protein, partial [Meiothermus silvanus]|nr:DUF933 domain-containing protein [Allomeiothermus silvanus]
MGLLTYKPVIYVANVAEEDLPDGARNPYVAQVKEYAAQESADVVVVSAKIEAELAELSEEEAAEYLKTLGLEESGLDRLVRVAYHTLGLITFFTAGEKEIRAWTVRRGTKAPQAAGEIHSDLERGFIRAEVIDWHKLVEAGGWAQAKERGWVRSEGKDLTIVGYAPQTTEIAKAVEVLKKEGISAEFIDPRTLAPLEGVMETIIQSVRKTGRLLTADEGSYSFCNCAEIIARVAEAAPGVKVKRLAFPDAPAPGA